MATNQAQSQTFVPPVVTVLGHVDHGKTTLLDAIRKTSIATREHGGITQAIGASSIMITHEGKKRDITFIDTPGHEAFSNMRSRGAQAADIGLLIVSAVDGVMPQTRESIELLKQSGLPYIVVLTKADLIDRSAEKTKQQLLKEGVMLDGLGGDVPYIEVSAKTGKNIQELLELIILVFDIHLSSQDDSLVASANKPLQAIIIESKLDQKAGPKATVIVKNGTVAVRDDIVCEGQETRIRMLVDTFGKQVKQATVGQAVEVLGFTKAPGVGSIVTKKGEKEGEKMTKKEVEAKEYAPNAEAGSLGVIICADTLGSLEAITEALPKQIQVIAQKTGEITEADVLLAKSAKAVVIGFNTKVRTEVARLAMEEKVLAKNYTIIYELLDELKDVLEGKQLALLEKVYGKAKVLATFPYEKTKVLGVAVFEGRVAKGDKVRIERGETTVGEGTIASVRSGKNQVSKVEHGNECGIIITPLLDFTIGDMVICHG